MGMFSGVASAGGGYQKATKMDKIGEFRARIDKFKTVQSASGTYLITELTILEVISGEYTEGQFVNEMVQVKEHGGMQASFAAKYTAACIGVSPGHVFAENKSENEAIWEKHCEEAFGTATGFDAAKARATFSCPNPHQGGVLQLKVVADDQSGKSAEKINYRKDAAGALVLDEQGNKQPVIYKNVLVLGGVGPDDLGVELCAKYADKLKSFYGDFAAGNTAVTQ